MLVRGREPGIEYRVDHVRPADGVPASFVIATNLGATEFRLMAAPVEAPGDWRELAAGRPGERLVAAHAFADHVVLELRRDGFPLVEEALVTEPIAGGAAATMHPSKLGGTRHLSSAQFTHDQRGAMALVASQDGRFTIFAWSPCEKMVYAHRVETLLL